MKWGELGNEDGIWKFVGTGHNGEPPDQDALMQAMRAVPADYEFIELDLPPQLDYISEHRMLDGKPVRYIQAWDPIRNREIERIDFYARKPLVKP